MANNLVSNPIVLDTFNADVDLGNLIVSSVILQSAVIGEDAVFHDNRGVVNLHIAQNAGDIGGNGYTTKKFKTPFHFRSGLKFDASDSNGLDSEDRILIYLA